MLVLPPITNDMPAQRCLRIAATRWSWLSRISLAGVTRGVSDRSEMPYMGPMKENPTHPYMLDVAKLPDGRFQWAIRERGKLLQRSDRLHPSEPAAREHGFKAIEGLLGHATQDHRRR